MRTYAVMVFDEVFLHHVGAGVQSSPEYAEHIPSERLRVRRLLFVPPKVGDDGQRETSQAKSHPHQVHVGVARAQEQAGKHHHRCQGARGGGSRREREKIHTGG